MTLWGTLWPLSELPWDLQRVGEVEVEVEVEAGDTGWA